MTWLLQILLMIMRWLGVNDEHNEELVRFDETYGVYILNLAETSGKKQLLILTTVSINHPLQIHLCHSSSIFYVQQSCRDKMATVIDKDIITDSGGHR